MKPTKAAKAAPKKRKSLPETNVKKETPKKRSKFMAGAEESQEVSLSWVPKGKSWETDVSSVETILRDKDGNLYAYLNWRNGKKSKILIETCYEKCPQKVRRHTESIPNFIRLTCIFLSRCFNSMNSICKFPLGPPCSLNCPS